MTFSRENTDHPLWIHPKEDSEWKETIIREFKIHPVIAQILISRGFTSLEEIHDYLYAKLPDLFDPFLFPQMQAAVDRITYALQNHENILIYGDNDVDGMSGTALLTDFLRAVGCNVYFFVSKPGTLRQELIVEALDYAMQFQCKLLITVDCGITAASEIASVSEKNIDVIVTDHHEPTDKIPHCLATLNPKLTNGEYPNRDLTGVGVAFKLAHAVNNHLVEKEIIAQKKIDLKHYLDLVALGTIADMGPLRGENRILVRYGLKQLRKTKRIGLAKLISIADLDIDEVSPFNIASKIAPRLNSLGRIADPSKGVEILIIRNAIAAEKMAEELDLHNIERQKIERTISSDVDTLTANNPKLLQEKAIVMYSDKWHPGVIAILSARICKQYNRPTIMIAIENGIGKGSLRSITEFPLLPILKDLSELLINFGGHDYAAGLTIKEENIEEFKRRFVEKANENLSNKDVLTKLYLDAGIRFDELSFDFMESIRLLEPFGHENPQPILFCDAKQAWPPKVVGKTHLKLYLEQGDRMLEGIAIGKAHLSPFLRKRDLLLKVAFTPQITSFPPGPSIQLIVRDVKTDDGSSNS